MRAPVGIAAGLMGTSKSSSRFSECVFHVGMSEDGQVLPIFGSGVQGVNDTGGPSGRRPAGTAGATPAALSRKEYELLAQLASVDGRVLEREEIYQRVWGYTMARGDRSVDVFVRKLRQKLEKASPQWRYIHTHFGIGYRFAAEPLEVVGLDVPSSVPLGWNAGDQGKLTGTHQDRELAAGAL